MDVFSVESYGKEVNEMVHCKIKNIYRKRENYLEVFNALKNAWNREGGLQKLNRIHTDYEKAEYLAVKDVFGENFMRYLLSFLLKIIM